MKWSFLVLLAGCGRVGFDSVDGPNLGQLDPAFGDSGIARPSMGVRGEAWDIGLRGTGYLINGLTRPTDIDVWMDTIALTESGQRDPAWPGGGEQFLGPVSSTFGYGVTMRPEGGAYITGDGVIGAEDDNFIIAKLTATGVLDTSFGGDGYVDYNIAPTTAGDTAWAATLAGNTLYVCGVANYGDDPRFTVIAVRPDGSLDPTFATAGISTTNFTMRNDVCQDIAYDGTLLVTAGAVGNMIATMNFDLTGATSGPLTLMQGRANGIAIAEDGARIVVAEAGAGGYVMRIAGDALDPAFGEGGVVATPRDAFYGVALDADGRIIAVGSRDDSSPVIRRFLADGDVDPSFGDAGELALPFSGMLFRVEIDAKGRIVAAGFDDSGPSEQPMVVRLH